MMPLPILLPLSLPVHQVAGGRPHCGESGPDCVPSVHYHQWRAAAHPHLGQQQRQPATTECGEGWHAHASSHHLQRGGGLQLRGQQQRGEPGQEVHHHSGAR